MANLFIKKDVERLIKDAEDPNAGEGQKLKRTLGAFNLIMLGIGAIIGAGIFTLTGAAAAYYAGPGIVYSFVIGGILCAFAGLCYAEMAAMVPVAGSAYAYSYATLGEVVAWIIGWDLILEYGFGSVVVAISWSGYFTSILTKTLGIQWSDTLLRFTKGPWEWVSLSNGAQVYGIWNLPGTLICLLLVCILYRGVSESALLNNIIVIIKIAIIVSFIALGWSVVNPELWLGNPSVSGLGSLVPTETITIRNGIPIHSFGWLGVLTGAGVVFFAYIGFDAVSTTAQECKNPRRDLPIGILVSLVFCTVLYILMAMVMTGVVPYRELGVPDPVAIGVDRIVSLHGWSGTFQSLLTFLVKLGALAGLTSVILVLMMSQTRVLYAMARDGLLPWFQKIHPVHNTPHIATITTGVFVALGAGLMPLSLVGELVSIGTLLAFALVCAGIPILRVSSPHVQRPFRTPLYWFVAPAGTLACFWVMWGLPRDTWIRLFLWLFLGFCVYFGYGYKRSKLRQESSIL